MIDHQVDEEMILRHDVSDEALEAVALVTVGELPTLPNTYCFACPSGAPRHRHQPISAISSSPKAIHSAVHNIRSDNRLEYAGTSKLGPVLPLEPGSNLTPSPRTPEVGAVISQIKYGFHWA